MKQPKRDVWTPAISGRSSPTTREAALHMGAGLTFENKPAEIDAVCQFDGPQNPLDEYAKETRCG